MPVLAGGAPITGAAQPGRILLHHVGQGGDACRQAETLEARSDLLCAKRLDPGRHHDPPAAPEPAQLVIEGTDAG